MKIPFFNICRQNHLIADEIKGAISRVFDSGKYVMGPEIARFEENFAQYCGAKYCSTVSNGTIAIYLAIEAMESRNYNYFISPAMTFIASQEGIALSDHLQYLLDVDDTSTVDLNRNLIYKSANLLAVNLYGNLCNLSKLSEKFKDGKFILDCSQSHGALYQDQKVIDFCDACTYSFYPSKNLGTVGEGGAIVTNSKELYDKIQLLKNHGSKEKYNHEILGTNARMGELEAAALNVKLKYLDEFNDKRIKLAERYINNLKDNKNIKLLKTDPKNRCVWHIFPIYIENRDKIRADLLNNHGIECAIHYPKAVHQNEPFKNVPRGTLTNAEWQAVHELSLPLWPEMEEFEVDEVCEKLQLVIKNNET